MKIYEYEGKKNICGEQIRRIRTKKETFTGGIVPAFAVGRHYH